MRNALHFTTTEASSTREFMDGHKTWLKRGFDDGVFLLPGSLEPGMGGGILAHNTSLPDLQKRVNEEPFVVKDIASMEIIELDPAKPDERLRFLIA